MAHSPTRCRLRPACLRRPRTRAGTALTLVWRFSSLPASKMPLCEVSHAAALLLCIAPRREGAVVNRVLARRLGPMRLVLCARCTQVKQPEWSVRAASVAATVHAAPPPWDTRLRAAVGCDYLQAEGLSRITAAGSLLNAQQHTHTRCNTKTLAMGQAEAAAPAGALCRSARRRWKQRGHSRLGRPWGQTQARGAVSCLVTVVCMIAEAADSQKQMLTSKRQPVAPVQTSAADR